MVRMAKMGVNREGYRLMYGIVSDAEINIFHHHKPAHQLQGAGENLLHARGRGG